MTEITQKFSVSYADKAKYKDGLRNFLEYRDLGVSEATNGDYRAHVLRVKKSCKVIRICTLLVFINI